MINTLLLGSLILATQVRSTVTDSFPSQPIQVNTTTGTLFGSLVLPTGSGKHPVVLIIPGSGPTDRDGNSPMAAAQGKTLHPDTYKLLAEGLAAHGIASVRYDKRGIAASRAAIAGMNESDYRFDTGVDDARIWIKNLEADKRFAKIVVAGHSEGSLIGMLAAEREGMPGFVSLDGAGRPAAIVLREQLIDRGVPESAFKPILDKLSAGQTVDSVPPMFAALFRPSIQPYLISWFKYDPAKELAKLGFKTLIIQGSHDVQVSAVDARLLGAVRGAQLVTVEGMTHVLKRGPADAAEQFSGVYTDPTVPIAPEIISAIVAYVDAAPQPR